MNRQTLNVAALTAYCALIYWLSDQSKLPIPLEFRFGDKIVHAVAYGVMGWLAWQIATAWINDRPKRWLAATLFCSFYGITDEYHQSFVAGRFSDPFDWLADTLGAAAVCGLLWTVRRDVERRKTKLT